MELQREVLVKRAMTERVDLERLYVELVEAAVTELHAIPVPEVHGDAMSPEGEELLRRTRSLGYKGLTTGGYKSVLCVEGNGEGTLLDHLESVIRVYGRFCSISDRAEVRCLIEAMRIFDPEFPVDALLHCLAETATNQVLDSDGIGMAEMRPIRSTIDSDLVCESSAIAHMVRDQIVEVLAQM